MEGSCSVGLRLPRLGNRARLTRTFGGVRRQPPDRSRVVLRALLDHLPDILSSETYRVGFPSKLLEVLIMLFGLTLVLMSARLLLGLHRV